MIIGPAVRWGCHYRPIGGGRTTITNITNNYSGSSVSNCGGGMSWFGGLMMGLPMLFMGIMNMIPMFRGRGNNGVQQQQVQSQQQEEPKVDKNLDRLKTLFPDIKWTDDDVKGRYTGVKGDKSYRGTYEEILTQLGCCSSRSRRSRT